MVPEHVPAIDLRSQTFVSRVCKQRVLLPAKYHVVLYLGTETTSRGKRVHWKKASTYVVTALTPAGVYYVPKALREFIKSLDCAQLVPAEAEKSGEKGKAA